MGEASRLKMARIQRGWSQSQLIAAMKRAAPGLGVRLPEVESLRTNIRRWENDHIVPGPEYRKVLRAVFAMTDEELGFPLVDETAAPVITSSLVMSREGLAHLGCLLDAHIDADGLIGAGQVLSFVEHEAQALHVAVREASGTIRRDVLQLAVRYNEFLGWLRQDTGRYVEAMAATNRACDLAIELGDPVAQSYLLMRKSNIASDSAEPRLAAALADAALRVAPGAPPRVQAVALRQAANAHAALFDADRCAAAIDRGLDVVCREDDDALAPYCNLAYVTMEAAACWSQLGQPARAMEVLTNASGRLPDGQRRDSGLLLARQATIHAQIGDFDQACNTGHEAVSIAQISRSARTISALRRLHALLRDVPGTEADRARTAVARLVATAA